MTQQTERLATQEPAEELVAPPPANESSAVPARSVTLARPGISGEDRLGKIQVRACVELGSAELLVREIASLAPGSVVQLDRLVGEPADLTVNGLVMARGDVVVVDDHLGLRISQLIGPDEGRGA